VAPPDDPAVAERARDVARARRGGMPCLVWSGPLPEARGTTDGVNRLVARRWWLFNGEGQVDEIDPGWARELLVWSIQHAEARRTELMPRSTADELAERFVALAPSPTLWFTNGRDRWPRHVPRPNPWNPLTDYSFDTGVVAAGQGRALIAWFTDHDGG
jgi:hypothetical protein